MTNEAYTEIQMAPFTAPPIRSYQWLRFGSVDVTFKGCLLDRGGQSIGNFELTIRNAPVTLTSSTSANSWVTDLEHEVSANREDLLCFEVTTTGSFPSATIQTVTMTREVS